MEPLLLIPGMMCDARLFTPQLAAFSGERAIMTAPLTGADTIPALAAQILAQAPESFALAGLSMGGIVAMEMIGQAPDRITRLCLMDTNPLAETEAVRRARMPQIEKARAGGLRSVMRDEMKPRYLTDGPNRGAILDLCMAMAEALGPEVFVSQSIALQTRPDQTETLKRLCLPTLILCGQDDTLCPPERHHLMASLIKGAHLKVIPNAGHLPVLEAPDATNVALETWLNEDGAG